MFFLGGEGDGGGGGGGQDPSHTICTQFWSVSSPSWMTPVSTLFSVAKYCQNDSLFGALSSSRKCSFIRFPPQYFFKLKTEVLDFNFELPIFVAIYLHHHLIRKITVVTR